MRTERRQLLFESLLKHSYIPSTFYNFNNQFIGLRKQLWFHCVQMKQYKQHKQPTQPVFHNNINGFMYFSQQRLLQYFLLSKRSHMCLLNTTTNTIRRWTQSTLSPSKYRIFGTFDPFHKFHPSVHESVAAQRSCAQIWIYAALSHFQIFVIK